MQVKKGKSGSYLICGLLQAEKSTEEKKPRRVGERMRKETQMSQQLMKGVDANLKCELDI